MKRALCVPWAVMFSGCGWLSDDAFQSRIDADGDTFVSVQFGGDDCDDSDPTVFPGAIDEPYDSVDQNCDGLSDFDADGDEYDSYLFGGRDCDDSNALVVDEFFWFYDRDFDGFGDMTNVIQQCEAPTDTISIGGDCDDSDPKIRPGAVEVCDGVDNNCDSIVDGASSEDAATYYPDTDLDGYGDSDPETWVEACAQPDGFVTDALDCDDADPEINPMAVEICNDLIDNNCNNSEDNCKPAGFGYVNPWSWSVRSRANYRVRRQVNDEVTQSQFGAWAGSVGDLDADGYDDLLVTAPDEAFGSKFTGRLFLFSGKSLTFDGLRLDSNVFTTAEFADNVIDNSVFETKMGYAAVALGDLNGDGYSDFAVENCNPLSSDSESSAKIGTAQIFLGGSDIWSRKTPDWSIKGIEAEAFPFEYTDSKGCALSVGDLNNDGETDLVIGTTGSMHTVGSTVKGYGSVYVAYGPITGGFSVQTSANVAAIDLSTTNTFVDIIGDTVVTGGDIDGDGFDELAVAALTGAGAPGAGGVLLKYGSATRLSDPTSDCAGGTTDCFDARFSGAGGFQGAGDAFDMGDVNGDGYDDLVVAAPFSDKSTGVVYVKYGASSRFLNEWSLWSSEVHIYGTQTGEALGISVDVVPGWDKSEDGPRYLHGDDEYADILIGAAGSDPSETVYLLYGENWASGTRDQVGALAALELPLAERPQNYPPVEAVLTGRVYVSANGDFNGDGYYDIVAGYPWQTKNAGYQKQQGLMAIFLGGGI